MGRSGLRLDAARWRLTPTPHAWPWSALVTTAWDLCCGGVSDPSVAAARRGRHHMHPYGSKAATVAKSERELFARKAAMRERAKARRGGQQGGGGAGGAGRRASELL
eukprot:COSAG04_NODE_2909_length_3395_cov_17.167779_5_plen_107_part_00